ncbi:MAG: flagellar hook basal-body protein [Deltaproteobacteria bacterium]|nr:flagellar hook basal-body protein [Deltaproteobacteria bacterium]
MSKDLYAALSGATATWAQIENLSNNVANTSTAGFKRGRMSFSLEGPEQQDGKVYAQATAITLDLSDGPLQADGAPTHLALQGRGFFAVQGPGETLYTRDGSFTLDTEGRLVTSGGLPVQGQGGEITLPPGESIRVAEDGRVYGSRSGELDRIALFDGPVRPKGDNTWTADGPMVEAEGARVVQGSLEGSNVDPMGVMVELIEASRYFEAYQRAMQTSDEADSRLNQSGGRT